MRMLAEGVEYTNSIYQIISHFPFYLSALVPTKSRTTSSILYGIDVSHFMVG